MKKFIFIIILISVSAKVKSQNWDSLSAGIGLPPRILYFDSLTNKLYVGGAFTSAGGKTIWGVASWDGNKWDSLGHGIDDPSIGGPRNTNAIIRYGSNLFFGGTFFKAGNIDAVSIAQWDGTSWDSVPGTNFEPNSAAITDMLVYNNELYISGNFDSVGGIPANCIAKWNGSNWSAIGFNYRFDLYGGYVNNIAFYHGNLYATGPFYDTLGNLCLLAKWDGFNWTSMASDMPGASVGINEMLVYHDELIVGGMFYQADGHPGNAIKKWNDTIWTDVGGSVQLISPNPQIQDMEVHNGKLYCSGTFQMIGGVPANGLAVWDGFNWCSFGGDFETNSTNTGTSCVAFYDDTMVVCGAFRIVSGDSMTRITQWIGGNYVDSCGNTTGIVENTQVSSGVSVYPNPGTEFVTFHFTTSSASRTIIVYDTFGREIWRRESDDSEVEFPSRNYSSGVYFYSVISDNTVSANGKFIVQH